MNKTVDGVLWCPRRMEAPVGGVFKIGAEGDEWRERPGDGCRTCSYCGSMHPDDLFSAIADGTVIDPTDKNYKIYVGASGRGKFYFQHLSDEEQTKFVDLVNARQIAIGHPGRFYVLPFFMAPA